MNTLISSFENLDARTPVYTTSKVEINRLLSAAIVSRSFCNQLLKEPQYALSKGYQGETFQLTQEERNIVLSIKAHDLASFANQVLVQCDRIHRYEKLPISQELMV